jgi:hypothetical protein
MTINVTAEAPCVEALALAYKAEIEFPPVVVAYVPCAYAETSTLGAGVYADYQVHAPTVEAETVPTPGAEASVDVDAFFVDIVTWDDPILDGYPSTVKGNLKDYEGILTAFKTIHVMFGLDLNHTAIVKKVTTDEWGQWEATWDVDLTEIVDSCTIKVAYGLFYSYKNIRKDISAKPTTSLSTPETDASEYFHNEPFLLTTTLLQTEPKLL